MRRASEERVLEVLFIIILYMHIVFLQTTCAEPVEMKLSNNENAERCETERVRKKASRLHELANEHS